MTTAGLIGLSAFAAFVLATATLAVLRTVFVNWCPACGGSGCEAVGDQALGCTACDGSGVLCVPDRVPWAWDERSSEVA